jgi:hypothetical protein
LASAAVVFYGPHAAVSRYAAQRGVSRQTLYREADGVVCALDPRPHEHERARLRQQLADLQAQVDQLHSRLAVAVVVDAAKQAEFVATAQALGASLSTAHRLLTVLLRANTPSRADLGRRARDAGRRAGAALQVLDAFSRPRAQQVAADEIFTGQRPVLMTLEQDSLCWLGGRLAARRDGTEWAAEFRALVNAVQVASDRGQGLRKGLHIVNAERQRQGQPAIADQSDHFHPLRRAQQALRQRRAVAERALTEAERLQTAYDEDGRQGRPRTGAQGHALHEAWRRAEAAFDAWGTYERALGRLRAGLRLFTPEGALNTPDRATAEVEAAMAAMAGPGYDQVKRGLGPEAFTFLRRAHEQLAALAPAPPPLAPPAPPPLAPSLEPELVRAALHVEGLRARPEALQADGSAARARRAVLLAATLALALAGKAGVQAQARVRGVLQGTWRASSLVEGLNSVLRMHQGRQKRLTQGLLDLKRLHWNLHTFSAGKRKKSSPYGRLGLVLPPGSWWDLLQRPPEQLRQELSALNQAS